jgi:phosphate transport system protein
MHEQHISSAYDRDLDAITTLILKMGGLVEDAIENALLALSECDLERAERVKQGDDAIDDMFLDIEQRALSLLAQQQPVAGDLRLIVTILRPL